MGREQLAAEVKIAQANAEVAQKALREAERALYEYDLIQFTQEIGLKISDELLINAAMRAILMERGWASFLIDQWVVGEVIYIVGIDVKNRTFSVGAGRSTGSTSDVPLSIVRAMRSDWLVGQKAGSG